MKEFFQHWNMSSASRLTVDTANQIIGEYLQDGYTLTLRQLYYQFVARDLIENSERSYKNLGNAITKARMAGLIDWNAIEDRNREHHTYWFEEHPINLIQGLPNDINFDLWERQDFYVEVWVEKEALGNVISRACRPLAVPYMSCKGYLSASEMYRAGKRFERKLDEGKDCVLIHLGDHDPSGIDMTRDNDDRVGLFSHSGSVDVRRIALNIDQIDEYAPPPNPTKVTDSRAKDYMKRFGQTSWELDALEPSVLSGLITDEVNKFIDTDAWNETLNQQAQTREILHKLRDNWGSVVDHLGDLDNE